MRNLMCAVFMFIILFASSANAADPEVYGEGVFNSGAVVCSGYTPTTAIIANPHNFPIRILRVRSWVGLDYNRAADIGFSAQRLSDGNFLFRYLADRYANPSVGPDQLQELTPGIVLQPNDSLYVVHYCSKLGTTATVHGHFAFDWWWIKEL